MDIRVVLEKELKLGNVGIYDRFVQFGDEDNDEMEQTIRDEILNYLIENDVTNTYLKSI